MKYVILSFDDGRKDTYDVAYKLLMKYNFTASIHITTGLVDETLKRQFKNTFPNIDGMSIDNIVEMAQYGFDISSHGDMHINEENDLKNSLIKLKNWGILNTTSLSLFSSPRSEIYTGNIAQYTDMLEKNGIRYLRTGNQVKRNGLLYCLLYVLQMLSKSRILFYILNKRNIMHIDHIGISVKYSNIMIIKGTAVKYWHSIKQLKYFLEKLNENELVVFLFHGIIYEKDIKKADSWIFSAEKFEKFLEILKNCQNIKILNIKEYIELC